MNNLTMERLLQVSIALSSEKDHDRLLETILTAAMDITLCDGGTLYQLENDSLYFRNKITRSQNVWEGGSHGHVTLPPVTLSRENACACAVLCNTLINIKDVYCCDGYDFSGPCRYDKMTGYHTQSMLIVPMENDQGQIIGVLQLINALDDSGRTIPFAKEFEPVILALGAQAAICLTNMNYAMEIRDLLDSFVGVMSAAIDERTSYNANHTRNMVKFAVRFLDWQEEQGNPWHMTRLGREQFLMCVWLHDIGKLNVPLSIMDKSSRLTEEELREIFHRLTEIELNCEIEYLRGKLTEEAYGHRLKSVQQDRQLILDVNRARYVTDDRVAQIEKMAQKPYFDRETGRTRPLLTEEEKGALMIRYGTLTAVERAIMQNHVVTTSKMLSRMHFPRIYEKVPSWAGEHHEFLNGQGYPKGLTEEQIAPEVRLLTVLDIFEALTAHDRPYKDAVSAEQALDILDEMVSEGKLDADVVAQFRRSRVWEAPEDGESIDLYNQPEYTKEVEDLC